MLGDKGTTLLSCTVNADGSPANCAVVIDNPSYFGFGAAAQSIAPKFKLKTDHAKLYGKNACMYLSWSPTEVKVIEMKIITNPTIISPPNSRQLLKAYPKRAYFSGIAGGAKMECEVTVSGSLANCAIKSEAPEAWGFGDAALKLAPYFVMKPQTENGKPVGGGKVIIPLNWNMQ